MGFGNYSALAHQEIVKARRSEPLAEVFARNDCDPAMNPRGVKFRECRDSEPHPNSVGIVFALDVSGSMEQIPHELATQTLPTFMEEALRVVSDPQILFMAFGNAYADNSPLQVGQFESEAPLIDRWLAATHVEMGGGGLGESYGLAMYFAARHTAMDCLEKRGRKGYFFMTGDEVPFMHVNAEQVRGLIGDPLEGNILVHTMVAELLESFHAFFLIPDQKRADTYECGPVWKLLLHERCIILEDTRDTARVCALLMGIQEGKLRDRAALLAHLEGVAELSPADVERIVRTVLPFAEALARGPIAAPVALARREQEPDVQG